MARILGGRAVGFSLGDEDSASLVALNIAISQEDNIEDTDDDDSDFDDAGEDFSLEIQVIDLAFQVIDPRRPSSVRRRRLHD